MLGEIETRTHEREKQRNSDEQGPDEQAGL